MGIFAQWFKDYYDYWYYYYRYAPFRIYERVVYTGSLKDWKEYSTVGIFTLDVDTPVTTRMGAGILTGLKFGAFASAISYRNQRTRYRLNKSAAFFKCLKPGGTLFACIVAYSFSIPLVRSLRGQKRTERDIDFDMALVGGLTGLLSSIIWIRNINFFYVAVPFVFFGAGINYGLYNAAHQGYATKPFTMGGYADPLHWKRGSLFGPDYDERIRRFEASLKDAKYREYYNANLKTQW
ncbi:unnamed protein product [Didymodactylos carnosus]|uniref:Uncharacterized protein n=1 Tax=Didymodactylos carnosus TaxID=1234261 RepID=A0A814AB12_9BILA|nr:unnamed protein product [Didymodactylos carnosus]CAF0909750.1 unnamed protein product [Didymodactylos carnosus]CAF3504500.1 unnamed protein product [Didymodactylos carnosus]CAF3691069.1 unnamed protein product [Didymodactylos carnosus]